MYLILQWTPFPNKFENMPEWQLQKAEYDLKLNKKYYYENAIRKGSSLFYPLEIAKKIVEYWEIHKPHANFQLQKEG